MSSTAKTLTLSALTVIAVLPTLAVAQNYGVAVQSQRDGRWAGEKLGFSSVYTIGSDGCVDTSYSMVLTSFGVNCNPSSTNAMLKSRNAFSGALVIWSRMPNYAGALDYTNRPADLSTIKAYLIQGYRMIVETRMGASHQFTHYVLVNGVTADGKDLMAVDPWFGDRVLFSQRFGSPSRYVYSVKLFH